MHPKFSVPYLIVHPLQVTLARGCPFPVRLTPINLYRSQDTVLDHEIKIRLYINKEMEKNCNTKTMKTVHLITGKGVPME